MMMQGAVDGEGRLTRMADNEVAGMIHALVGCESTPESSLRFQLQLSHKSMTELQEDLSHLQHKYRLLDLKYQKAKEESALNARAMRKQVADHEELQAKLDQLRKECELYHSDREVFAEAAEDAEERRAEAERQALDAEKRAVEAQRREEAALKLVKQLMTKSSSSPTNNENDLLPNNVIQLESANQLKEINCNSSASCSNSSGRGILVPETEDSRIIEKKRKLTIEEDPSFLSSAVMRNAVKSEKENLRLDEMNGAMIMRKADQSEIDRLTMKTKRLIRMMNVGQNNLLKAELEADLIRAKNLELRKLLTDILVAFGIFPRISPSEQTATEA